MPYQQPNSPYASPVAYYPVHVPAAKRPKAKADKTKAHDKARKLIGSPAILASADAPHCSAALARASGDAVQGCDYGPGIMAELRAMPEGLASAISNWAAARTRHSWVDADGMRHTAPSDPYSDLASAMPRKVWLLCNGKPTKAKPLSGTHGKARRRSNWDANGNVRDLSVLLRGALSNLRRQERRNGGETFKVETDATTKAQTAAIQIAREQEARDRRTVAEHRASLREQRLALRASMSPERYAVLLASVTEGGPLSGATRNILCAVRKMAIGQLTTAPMAD